MESILKFRNVDFKYGKLTILKDLTFDIVKGETLCIVGESGCGKTTTLALINGLLKPSKGSIIKPGPPSSLKLDSVAWRRKTGFCVQGSLLFPHLTLSENIGLVAQKEGWSKEDISHRMAELFELVNLPFEKSFLLKKPREISGGQRQRISLARALFLEPKILLMDEPFGALDPITKNDLQDEFLKLRETLNLTIVLVTHDLTEAFKMGHKIMLLSKGSVEQHASPREFFQKPATPYVKKFTTSQLKTVVKVMDLMKENS